MPAINTVEDIIAQSRILLQDTIPPYRYPTPQLVDIFNMAMLDARRLRPDMFLASPTAVPFYAYEGTADPPPDIYPQLQEPIAIDQQYRLAFVYFVVGQADLRDEEDTQDTRAAAFLLKFTQMMIEPLGG